MGDGGGEGEAEATGGSGIVESYVGRKGRGDHTRSWGGGAVGNTRSAAGNSMTSSKRPSPDSSPAALRGKEFWNCSGSLNCVEL